MSLKSFGVDASFGYSQAVRLGDLVFVSGQVAWDENHQIVGGLAAPELLVEIEAVAAAGRT